MASYLSISKQPTDKSSPLWLWSCSALVIPSVDLMNFWGNCMSGGVEDLSTHSFSSMLGVLCLCWARVRARERPQPQPPALLHLTASHVGHPPQDVPSGHPPSLHAMLGVCCTSSSVFPVACSADSVSRNGCGFAWKKCNWPPALFGGKRAPLQGCQTSTSIPS